MSDSAVPTPAVISLLTDFGLDDGFVGIMRGVIAGLAPGARVIDITHKVKPQHLAQGAMLLRNAYPYFPRGTIHVAVVDPGVGGSRRPIVVRTPDHFFVGPDNGLFTLAYRHEPGFKAFHLDQPRYWRSEVSNTFHGRDIFAPVAAHLALGVPPEEMGSPVENPVHLRMLEPKVTDRKIIGKIIYADNFGNLITNIGGGLKERIQAHDDVLIKAGGKSILGISLNYNSVERGQLVALFGSTGLLEVSVNFGSAMKSLQVNVDDSVEVIFR